MTLLGVTLPNCHSRPRFREDIVTFRFEMYRSPIKPEMRLIRRLFRSPLNNGMISHCECNVVE